MAANMTGADGTSQHIVAFGGGGLSVEPEHRLLDEYILDLTGKSQPRVCFVGTASGDAESYLLRFYQTLAVGRGRAGHLALFRRTVTDIRAFILEHDVVYVGGGNTANLLAIWRLHGLDTVLREAWAAGVVLCG